jgi:NAD(P)-dependent dehydrogenase (short-subunit alcohol dehydrogenase family)
MTQHGLPCRFPEFIRLLLARAFNQIPIHMHKSRRKVQSAAGVIEFTGIVQGHHSDGITRLGGQAEGSIIKILEGFLPTVTGAFGIQQDGKSTFKALAHQFKALGARLGRLAVHQDAQPPHSDPPYGNLGHFLLAQELVHAGVGTCIDEDVQEAAVVRDNDKWAFAFQDVAVMLLANDTREEKGGRRNHVVTHPNDGFLRLGTKYQEGDGGDGRPNEQLDPENQDAIHSPDSTEYPEHGPQVIRNSPNCSMKLEGRHVAAFAAASDDRNPLHLDAEYARRSQFGRPVVYGMAAVLYSLGAWAKGRPFRLRNLRAVFRKPLFEGEEYDWVESEKEGEVTCRFRKGPVDYAVVIFEAEWKDIAEFETNNIPHDPKVHNMPVSHAFVPDAEAASNPMADAGTVEYSLNADALAQLGEAFQLPVGIMPLQQLSAILWSSYHVGMKMPGRQALFSELQMGFENEGGSRDAGIKLELEEAEWDERFNRFTLRGKGTGIGNLYIAAFKRPLPVDFPLGGMPRFADGYLPLQGKVVFISGATRGFGAAVARMCGLAGARLALNYRGDAAAAQALCEELRGEGIDAEAFPGDMTDPEAVAGMTAAIAARFGHLDLIVNNAAPPIRDLQFLEQDNAHFLQFVQQNLAITLETARQLLPLLTHGGHFLHISTKYLVEPVRGFAHYLTAKAAQEALIQALSLEFRDLQFLVARLPRILTDQTNLAFDFDPPQHPGEVAREALMAVMEPAKSGNFRVVELWE